MASSAGAAAAIAPPLAKQAMQRLNAGVVRALRVRARVTDACMPRPGLAWPVTDRLPLTALLSTRTGLAAPGSRGGAGRQARPQRGL